jgi:hypothetical protein
MACFDRGLVPVTYNLRTNVCAAESVMLAGSRWWCWAPRGRKQNSVRGATTVTQLHSADADWEGERACLVSVRDITGRTNAR